MPPVVAFMDLLFLVPLAFGAGLIYLVVATWWANRRRPAGRPAPKAPAELQAGSAADAPTAPAAVLAAGMANDRGGDDFDF